MCVDEGIDAEAYGAGAAVRVEALEINHLLSLTDFAQPLQDDLRHIIGFRRPCVDQQDLTGFAVLEGEFAPFSKPHITLLLSSQRPADKSDDAFTIRGNEIVAAVNLSDQNAGPVSERQACESRFGHQITDSKTKRLRGVDSRQKTDLGSIDAC